MSDHTASQPVRLADYSPPAWIVDDVTLRFELDPHETIVHSRIALRRNGAAAPGALVLQGVDLELRSLKLDGRTLAAHEYQHGDEELRIAHAPARCTLETVVALRPADNTCLEGLYVSSGNFCTQCEPEGFRRITFYLDRPDVMARFSTTLVAHRERCPVLLSNGNPVANGTEKDGRHWVRWEDPFPKPSYLFALVAGDLACIEDSYTTRSGREVALRIYVQAHNADKCAHAMRSLANAMRWDEQVYGLEYDLDIYMIVAVDDFNMGAMENKGLNVFNSKYVLADPATATDSDFQAVEGVIAHEYFHNWSGNRVTLRDWFQLSLKEGLTVFRDQEFSADVSARASKRIEDVRLLRQRQFAEDAGPMAHPVRPDAYLEINNFYTLTVYEKGAEVIRMLHTLLGAADYHRGIELYFSRHDGQAVTCDDFVRAMEDASGRDLEQFRFWYSQAGTPVVEAEEHFDADAACYRLTLRQSTPPTPGQEHKRPLHIPVRLALLGGDGEPLALRLRGENAAAGCERVLELREAEQTFEFEGVQARPVPSLLRGFSAPVKLANARSEADLAFLMAHDGDAFNRWDAAQSLALGLLLRMVRARAAGQSAAVEEDYLRAAGAMLDNAAVEPALRAAALSLPSEDYIGDALPSIDVDAVHDARQALRESLARRLEPSWLALRAELADPGPYRLDAQAVGRRRLRNLALAYLGLTRAPAHLGAAREQFASAGNMTDEMAALAVLVEAGPDEREAPLAAFYDKWQSNPLVIDKWFALQATASAPDTLERVKRLLGHTAFDLRNPNRVRALLGAFCMSNPVRFHDASGAGYVLLADYVLQLDPMNPQVAARLVAGFTRWRRYDAARRKLMSTQLERLAGAPGLSRDVNEIVGKTLSS